MITTVMIVFPGSVAFPKPITFTNRIWVTSSRIPWHGGRDLCGTIVSAHAVPVFHGMGLGLLMYMVRPCQTLRLECE